MRLPPVLFIMKERREVIAILREMCVELRTISERWELTRILIFILN